MSLPLQTDPVPLREDGRGGYRVGSSRVPLDVVLDEYDNGADPESIVNAYPTLQLADVYAVIAYYLRHREEVSVYLREREAAAAELRREIESRQGERQAWEEEFAAAARRPLPLRLRYAFVRTYKPILDDAPYRSFERMDDYRRWCETQLPSWLGYGRI